MIGVVAEAADRAAVEEFFELFKTPWEFARPGCAYEVLLAAVSDIPEVEAKLILHYSSNATPADAEMKLVSGAELPGATVRYAGREFPVYGSVRMFQGGGAVVLRVEGSGDIAGVKTRNRQGATVLRLGYDLFAEITRLLNAGQPIEQAGVPTLELHIALVRDAILSAGLPLVEIPPRPAGKDFIICLTHDIDFFGIRNHWFDHTLFGFLYRATAGAALDFVRGRISLRRMAQNWLAVLKVPLVHLGWAKDFWISFDWYLQVEAGLPATYFFIPFKGRAGVPVGDREVARRAAPYDVAEQQEWLNKLRQAGCEIGVHGIDAWHDPAKGRAELARITELTGQDSTGIRMHWLFQNEQTPRALDEAGYAYDTTAGYNEAVGYRCGTVQVFQPTGARRLLELPLHIQDGALFYPGRLGLTEETAWQRCQELLANAREFGGVLTLLWHDRSPDAERFWGDFYARLVETLRREHAWFAAGGQAVSWFRRRREVCFERADGSDAVVARRSDKTSEHAAPGAPRDDLPPLCVRVHRPRGSGVEAFDFPWADEKEVNVADLLAVAAAAPRKMAAVPVPA